MPLPINYHDADKADAAYDEEGVACCPWRVSGVAKTYDEVQAEARARIPADRLALYATFEAKLEAKLAAGRAAR